MNATTKTGLPGLIERFERHTGLSVLVAVEASTRADGDVLSPTGVKLGWITFDAADGDWQIEGSSLGLKGEIKALNSNAVAA